MRISLPAAYRLSAAGSRYFGQHNIPVREVVSSDRTRYSVIDWEHIKVDFLQKMVSFRLIDAIEINRTETTSKRADFLKLTRDVCYGVIRRHFRVALKQRLRAIAAVDRLLKRPSLREHTTLDGGISPTLIRSYVSRNAAAIDSRRVMLALQAKRLIDQRDQFVEEKQHLLDAIIDAIDDESWFLQTVIEASAETGPITDALIEVINEHFHKASVADYSALILSEMLVAAEHTQFRILASRDNGVRSSDTAVDELLRKPAFRDRLAARAAALGRPIRVAFVFDANPYNPERDTVINVEISNLGLIGYADRLATTRKRDRRTLVRTLEDLADDSADIALNGPVLQIYLGGLAQAASQLGVDVQSVVELDEVKEQSTTRIRIAI